MTKEDLQKCSQVCKELDELCKNQLDDTWQEFNSWKFSDKDSIYIDYTFYDEGEREFSSIEVTFDELV